MQRVGGLEDGHRATRPAVGKAQRLEHLVGAVGREHLGRVDTVVGGDGLPQRPIGPIRVAVPVELGQLRRQRLAEPLGGRLGGLVGVEPDIDLHLGRVVPGQQGEIGPRADHRAGPRRTRIDSAWASRPS